MAVRRLLVWVAIFVGADRVAQAEWTLAAYLGGTRTQETSVELDQPSTGTHLSLGDVEFEGQPWTSPIYYGLRIGYFPRRAFGVEAEFIHLKVFAKTDQEKQADGLLHAVPLKRRVRLDSVMEQFSISHGLNFVLGSIAFRKSIWQPVATIPARVLFTARAGAGGTVSHPESTIQGLSDQHYELGGPAAQAGGGIEVRLWRGFHWLGEYKYTWTRQSVEIVGGTAKASFHTHHLVTGFSYHF